MSPVAVNYSVSRVVHHDEQLIASLMDFLGGLSRIGQAFEGYFNIHDRLVNEHLDFLPVILESPVVDKHLLESLHVSWRGR